MWRIDSDKLSSARLLVPRAAIINLIVCSLAIAAAQPTAPPPNEGDALAADFNHWNKLQGVLPHIEGGKAVGDLPKTVSLLQFVINDYQKRASPQATAIDYAIVAGAGQAGDVATDVGAFRRGNSPLANYMIALGLNVDNVDSAVVLATVHTPAGLKTAQLFLRWQRTDGGLNWVPWKTSESTKADVQVQDIQ